MVLEYKHRYGILGYYFYYFMFKIISSKLKFCLVQTILQK